MNFFSFLIVACASILIAASMIFLSYLFGPKKPDPVKEKNFECGMEQASCGKKVVRINFYFIAVLFLIFDIEIIYLYPWAVSLKNLSDYGFYTGAVFIILLIITIFYLIKREALKWD